MFGAPGEARFRARPTRLRVNSHDRGVRGPILGFAWQADFEHGNRFLARACSLFLTPGVSCVAVVQLRERGGAARQTRS